MNKVSKNYFPTPNEIFSLGLSPGKFAVYAYLLRCANRRTHQCWPSYKTIGTATQMSVNTVRKHNGSLLYTIRPFQDVLESHQQSELCRLEVERARWKYAKTVSL